MKKKRSLPIGLVIVFFVLCSLFMYILQLYLFYRNADREIDLTFKDVDRIVSQALEDTNVNYDSYELINTAKAKMARYYIRNDEDTGYSATSMKNLKQLLNVTNVYLVDSGGDVVYSADKSDIANFYDSDVVYLSYLQEISGTNRVSEFGYFPVRLSESPEEVTLHSFCGVSLNNGYYIVIEEDAENLLTLQSEAGSLDALLPRITLARNGFVFAVGWDGWVSAFPGKYEKEVDYISGLGIELGDIKDGFRGTLMLQGDKYYCGAKYYPDYELYIICAIPSDEITSNVLAVTAVPLFVAFVFLALQLLYSMMLMGGYRDTDADSRPGSVRMFMFRKMALLLVLSFLFSVGSSLYTQVLYSMYLQAQSNKQEAKSLAVSLSTNDEIQKKTSEEYYTDLGNLTTLAAKFISNNRQITRNNLSDMAKNLGAEHILLYDKEGEVILSDAYYKGLRISPNNRDLSNEFKKVLTGTPVLVQQTVDATFLDKPYRYAGAIVTDANDELNGFVQLAFSPDYLESSLKASSVESLPSTFSGRNNAFAFITDGKKQGDKQAFLYYPDEDLIGEKVRDHGLTEEMMQDNFYTITSFDGEERLLYSDINDDNMIFTAASVNDIAVESVSRGIFISLAGIAIQLLFFITLMIFYDRAGKNSEPEEGSANEKLTPDDIGKQAEKLATGRITGLIKSSFFVFSGAVFFILMLRNVLFKNSGVLLSLLNGNWNTGIHVFSVTACWINVCIVYFVVSLILLTLELMGKLMNSRGETVIRMLISFTRYIAVIGTAFYCAKLLGAPTDTLLASAGILTVVIGLGAQSLVTDVLAGLFIIFERSFKVGDIIRIDGEKWRGRVLEIGIRNTKVMDIDEGNIKSIHNSSLHQIINLSELPTYVYTTIGIEYGEELARVEAVIAKELPAIRERIPQAIEGPRYSGVAELGDSAVILKFATQCRNEDFYRVRYDVNRELKLMFDRNSITVPFPQVVVNERS